MEKRHYADFFTVPHDYKPNMTREAINETPDTWLDFYPHQKYVDFLTTLIDVINGGSKSLWLTGNYGTGKSNAALVTQKLLMDDEDRVLRWFNDCKDKISDGETLLKKLLARRSEGTLVVYDYNASGVGPNEDFLVRLERGIIAALHDQDGMIVPAKANLDEIIQRVRREDKHFFDVRDSIQDELAYLTKDINTAAQLVTELQKAHHQTDAPTELLGDVQKVLHKDNIFLDISVPTFRKWILDILATNNIKRIVYIFDEFSEFIDENKSHLKTFEDVTENPGINKFYLVPVTHLSIKAYWAEGSENAQKANTRFYFRNLQMPNDTAFKLAYHAMKPNIDPIIADEWKTEKNSLWEAVRGIAEIHFNSSDQSSADYVSKQSFYDILPIHPMAAFLLKFLSEQARSNQRSIFEYLKGSADGQEFQDFIHNGGPSIASKQFLTADYLWKYFIERDDLGLSKDIIAIRSEYERIKSREFQNKDEDDEDIRVLKAVLLFCLLSRLLTTEAHERLKPTVENIRLVFQGDGAIVGVDSIIKSLADKHCFSVVNGNIELFATSVGDADLQTEKAKYESKFHELLSDKTADMLKAHKKGDFAKFSANRFDLRVSDIGHTMLGNITSTRDRYSNGLNKDSGAVCLWFVVAKNKDDQLQVPEKIKNILTQLRDHRIMMFAFPNLTFCDTNLSLWNDYIEHYAKYMLENDKTAKAQCQNAYVQIEQEWFSRIKYVNLQIKAYTFVNGQIVANDTSWIKFKDLIGDYVRRTLVNSVDYLTEQTTAFGNSALKAWANAGIQFDAASGTYKQLVVAFKKLGITADVNWFIQNPTHPIAQIRSLFDKKMTNTIGKGTNLSIRKVYIELQRAPYGMKYNALSAFSLGIALRHVIDKGYQWDNGQKTGVLDVDILSEIIEIVVKDDGQDKIKYEKQICRLSREEKAFIEKAPKMFGISNVSSDARVEDVLGLIQNRLEPTSGRVPLWVLQEYIYSVHEPSAGIISEVLNNVCSAFTISSKGKTDDRTNAIKEVGRLILDNADLVDVIAAYTTKPENFITAFQMHVDVTAPTLVSLAKEIGDVSHEYCQSILDNAVETAGWLWKEIDISKEINETEHEYEIIKLLISIVGFTTFVPYKTALETLKNTIMTINKLPQTLIVTAVPSLSVLLSILVNNGAVNDLKESLKQNENIVKTLFFDITKAKSIDILKQRLTGVTISSNDLLNIYNILPNGFFSDESTFLTEVRKKIEDYTKQSVAKNILNEWERLTGSETPSAWALSIGIPARFALGGVSDIGDIISAVEAPDKFSSDKLTELLNVLNELSPLGIADSQANFIAETVSRRFTKFNISLSSLLGFLKGKYGTHPNNWPSRPDIKDFINGEYKCTFAPQIAEKIKKTSAEDLKNRLLQLAQDNPDLGLLFWE